MKSSIFNLQTKLTFTRNPGKAPIHRGMTLIELLVVTGIMMVLMAVTVPVLAPIAESRVARETSRGVQSALESARARAIRLGRPCGVALIPFHEDYPFGCISIEQLSAPPGVQTYCSVGSNGVSSVQSVNGLNFKRGDSVQVNYTGPVFTYTGSTWAPNNSAGFGYSHDYSDFGTTNNLPCTVNLFPLSDSNNPFAAALGIESSYILPKGYIVDLAYSGVGTGTWRNAIGGQSAASLKRYPPAIIFKPDGSAELYINASQIELSSQEDPKIYLMIGSWGKMLDSGGNSLADEEERFRTNWDDPHSFWLVINPKTGLITTARNDTDNGNRRNIAQYQTRTKGGN